MSVVFGDIKTTKLWLKFRLFIDGNDVKLAAWPRRGSCSLHDGKTLGLDERTVLYDDHNAVLQGRVEKHAKFCKQLECEYNSFDQKVLESRRRRANVCLWVTTHHFLVSSVFASKRFRV